METSIKAGVSAIINHPSRISQPLSQLNFKDSFTAKVDFVLYDDTNKEKFDKYGGLEAIGTIECRPIVNNMVQSGPPILARPINSNIRKFPIVNEIVRIIPTSDNKSQSPKGNYSISYFYSEVIGTWDSPEHNSVPDESSLKDSSPVGNRFSEKGTIRKLIHGPGDMTYEGRFGHSIRFGSSNATMTTPWKGEHGSPLIVITNNHKTVTNENNWNPTFEDINKDGSSIYFLSKQNIPIQVANDNFDSYNENINSSPKSNYIQPINTVPADNDKSANQIDQLPKTDIIFSQYTVSGSSETGSVQDDINFLPDNENQFSQELADAVLIGNDVPSDVRKSIIDIVTKSTTDGYGNTYGQVSGFKTSVSRGLYKELSIIGYQKTAILPSDLASLINSLRIANKFNLNIARAIMGVALKEQGYHQGGLITGGNYNHYGVQTDGGRWPNGVNNIQFSGQYFLVDGSGKYRAFAAFASEQDGILFVADQLTRKGFGTLSTSTDMAKWYIQFWWGNNPTQANINFVKPKFDDAFKLIK